MADVHGGICIGFVTSVFGELPNDCRDMFFPRGAQCRCSFSPPGIMALSDQVIINHSVSQGSLTDSKELLLHGYWTNWSNSKHTTPHTQNT